MIAYNKNNVSFAKEMRKNPTPWERRLWYDFLCKYPVRFQRQKAIGNYIADFYCARAKLVLELDGGEHYNEKQIERDKIRSAELAKSGLFVFRICNLDIDRNFSGVCEQIDIIVKSRINNL